jgi:hypothetical protein
MRKSHLNDEFLVLLGPIISRFFACSNEEKINQNNKGSCPISMHPDYLYEYTTISMGKSRNIQMTSMVNMGVGTHPL